MAQWFYGENGVRHGPVDDPQLLELVQTQRLLPSTLIWREGMPGWRSLAEVQAEGGIIRTSPSPYYPVGMVVPTSGMAVASLVLGILGLITCTILPGIPGVVFGHMALHSIKHSPTPVGGRGMAIAGLITGYLSVLCILAVIALLLVGFFASL